MRTYAQRFATECRVHNSLARSTYRHVCFRTAATPCAHQVEFECPQASRPTALSIDPAYSPSGHSPALAVVAGCVLLMQSREVRDLG